MSQLRKARLASKPPFRYALLYDVHRRAVQIRDLLRLMGYEEDIVWRLLAEYVSITMRMLPTRRLSWWKDDSYPPAMVIIDDFTWRQLHPEDRDLIMEMADDVGPFAGHLFEPLVECYRMETITNDVYG